MTLISKRLFRYGTLMLILLLAMFLRFWKLGSIPSGTYVDEAAIGYNAYSLLKTGLDEYGKSWPVFMRFFGAFSSPLYTFLAVLPIYVFGLSTFSVRFLSALFGVLVVLIVYLILKTFDFKHKNLATISVTFLYAISPWSVFLSRMGTEGHLGFFFTACGILTLIWSLKRSWWTIIAAIALVLATYTYQPLRLTSALIILGYVFLIWYKGSKIRDILSPIHLLSGIIFVVLQWPQIVLLKSPAFSFRAAGLVYKGDVLSWIREYFSQFTAYFSPKNLFVLGDEDLQRSIPTLGVFYFWQVILYLVGLVVLVRKTRDIKVKFTWWLMIVFAAVPALTRDPFSTVRSQGLLIPFMVIFAYGLDWFLSKYKTCTVFVSFGLLAIFSLLLLWRGFFVLLPFERARIWNYGFDQLVGQIQNYPNQTIVIDQSRTIPIYEEILFFEKFDPASYQKTQNHNLISNYYNDLNFGLERKFGNLEIRSIYWKEDVCRKLILVGDNLAVSGDQAKEHNLTMLFEIEDPNRELIFRAWETHPEKSCHPQSL